MKLCFEIPEREGVQLFSHLSSGVKGVRDGEHYII